MKNLLLTAMAVFAFGFANAQETSTEEGVAKGNMFLSGTASFGSRDLSAYDAKETSFVVAPKFGYFVTNNVALGVGLGFGSSKLEPNGSSDTYENKSTSFGAFGRYYIKTSKFAPFAELNVNYATAENDYINILGYLSAGPGVKVNTISANITPGFNYFFSKNFAIETSVGILGYSSSKADVDGAETENGFNVGLNLSNINFGLVYKF